MPDAPLHETETRRFLPVVYIEIIIALLPAPDSKHITAALKEAKGVNRRHGKIDIVNNGINLEYFKYIHQF
jgi:hypothetical protein